MENRPHILLTGQKHTGKSTLVSRLTAVSSRPVYGFVTVMDPPGPDGLRNVYMYPAALPEESRVRSEENLVGRCGAVCLERHPEVFETLGVKLIENAEPGGLLVMDELGFMETDAPAFRTAVLNALKGDIPVLAVVKERYDVPFLNTVRSAEKARLFTVDASSRETLFKQLSKEYPFI